MTAIAKNLTDAEIRAALADAHIPSLLLSLVHIWGNLDTIRGDIRPSPTLMPVPFN